MEFTASPADTKLENTVSDKCQRRVSVEMATRGRMLEHQTSGGEGLLAKGRVLEGVPDLSFKRTDRLGHFGGGD